jgi:hypothetical protein
MIWKGGRPWGLRAERLDNNMHLQMIVGSGHSIVISKYKVQGWWPLGAMELQLQAMVSLSCKTHATTLFIIVVIMFLTFYYLVSISCTHIMCSCLWFDFIQCW